MIRAVIDTNVLVSGLLAPAGNEALLLAGGGEQHAAVFLEFFAFATITDAPMSWSPRQPVHCNRLA